MLKANGLEEQMINWNAINWQEVYRIIENLRYRIFKATEERNWKKVRSLQKLMLRSKANVLLSVRRATQENAGKFTAGVDADIKGAFDNIDHEYLLKSINNFPARGIIKEWLKAGYMDGGIFNETETGTPQGHYVPFYRKPLEHE